MEAIEHVRALLEQRRFEEFIDASVERFTEIYQGPWREYVELVRAIAPDCLARFPEISVIAAAAASWFEPHTGLGWARVEQSVALMRAQEEREADPRRLMRSTGIELGAYRILSRTAEAAEAAARLEDAIDRLPAETLLSSSEMMHVFAVQIVGAYAQEGRFDDAVRAWGRMREDTNVWRQVHAQSMVAMSHAISGDIVAARSLTRSMAVELTAVDWQSSYNAVGWSIASALVAVEDGDAGTALRLLDALDGRLPAVDHWAYILAARARALALRSSSAEASDIIQELLDEHRGRRSSGYSLDLLRAAFTDLLVASGQTERGRALLEEGIPHGPGVLARARLLLREDLIAARSLASGVAMSGQSNSRLRAEALLTQAIAAERLGLAAEARELMVRLVASIERKGHCSVLMLAPRAEVLALLPEASAELEAYVRGLPDGVSIGIAAPAQLTPSEMRVLELLVRHQNIRDLAAELFVSQNTVKTHLRNVYRKLGVGDRGAAVSTATRIGLLG